MAIRLSKVIKEFNVGLQTVVDFLAKKGHNVEATTNTKITDEQYELLSREFSSDVDLKNEAAKIMKIRKKMMFGSQCVASQLKMSAVTASPPAKYVIRMIMAMGIV